MRNVCDGLTSDLEVASKFSRQSEGSVLGVVVGGSEWIFHIAVNALSVCPGHAVGTYWSTSDNVSDNAGRVWTWVLPYLHAPVTRYAIFIVTIKMIHRQWAQPMYGTAFFFLSKLRSM